MVAGGARVSPVFRARDATAPAPAPDSYPSPAPSPRWKILPRNAATALQIDRAADAGPHPTPTPARHDSPHRKRAFVLRADGSVLSRQYGNLERAQLFPGDTIVVPLDAERVRSLPLWQAVTSIIYNLAVALLAVRSV